MSSKDLQAKFNEWIMIFVMLPAAAAMVICNVFLWRNLKTAHAFALNELATAVTAQFEQILRAEAIRVRTMAHLPNITALLAMSDRRYSLRQRGQTEKLEEAWAASARDDMMVRGVMDNDVGNSFRLVCDQQPHISSLLLTDAHGALLAASRHEPRFFHNELEWWLLARSKSSHRVVSEGLSHDGVIGLNFARWRAGAANALHAIVREELKLTPLVEQISTPGLDNKYVVFVIGRAPIMMAGASNLFDEAAAAISERVREEGRATGWLKGCSFTARTLDADIYWARPIIVVTARGESKIPLSLYGPMAGGVVVGALAVFGVFGLAKSMGRKLFFDPMREAAEAGVWVLHKAFGDEAASARYQREHPWVKMGDVESAPVQKELAQWMSALQKDVQEQSSVITQSMRRDMDLAMEFQQALLNRPYPVVPAVHVEGKLRLEFHHRYHPALAVGGDFFSIEALDSDCAGIFLADVMGHGARSALVTSILRTLLAELYRQGRHPAHFIRLLNQNFCEILETQPTPFFASASYFVADTTARVATYTLAGHSPPILLHRSLNRVTRLKPPRPHAAALGVLPEEEYSGESVRLIPGDAFFFFTDGLYEASNRKGEEFGIVRVEEVLRSNMYRPTPEILDALMAAISDFVEGHPISDDICIVTVDIKTDAVKS